MGLETSLLTWILWRLLLFFLIPQCFAIIWGIWSMALVRPVIFCPLMFLCCEVKLSDVHPEFRLKEVLTQDFWGPPCSLFPRDPLFLSTPLCSDFFCHTGLLTIFWYARHAVQSARKVFSKIASSPPSNLCVKVTFSITLSVTVLFKSSNHLPLYTLLIPFAYIVSVLALGTQFF